MQLPLGFKGHIKHRAGALQEFFTGRGGVLTLNLYIIYGDLKSYVTKIM